MLMMPASGARKNSQLRSTARRRASVSWRATPMVPYTREPRSRRKWANCSGSGGTLGLAMSAWVSSASTSRSRAPPEAKTTCHGWMLEFEGARMASSSASVTSSRGTGLSRRNSRVE